MLSAVATAIPSAAPVAVSSVPAPVAVDTENAAAAAADQDMLSMIIQGYSDDPWFATANHKGSLNVFQGLFLTSKNPSCKNCMVLTTQGNWLSQDNSQRQQNVPVAWHGYSDT